MAHDGHRQRLKDRFSATGGAGVADYELLELTLTFAIPRRDVKPLAKALLARFGSLAGVLTAPPEDLASMPGLGPASVLLVQLVQQLTVRMKRAGLQGQPVLADRLTLLDYLYTRFASSTREEGVVLFLNAQLTLLAEETLFTGTQRQVAASPREIIKKALVHNASGLIFSHNHPHGAPQPSAADEAFTQQLQQAASALGLTLHDHLIIGADAHYSFKGAGKL
ncbi:MAG: DNA repair protein RadC [Alphaproteobacteria bacterium]|jgi:DNA repair protein RadC|nr:DNA repair protein RadC [Alphaproteobacteria bacterium]